jgi:signal transduction histidine kinase
MKRSISITRRLIVSVLLLEAVSALALVGAITVHERHVQLNSFDASLKEGAAALMGAVQDAEDEGDNVMLDLRTVQLGNNAVYRVQEVGGKVLGAAGEIPALDTSSSAHSIQDEIVRGRSYRFITLHGLRIIDPGKPNGGVPHSIIIIYGTPSGHVWHEVLEAVRFFVIATALLLSITAAVMVFFIRKGLQPIYELAHEAEKITSSEWHFDAPASAKETVELLPLATALEAALARLRLSFEQQKRFTSDAAHELKTDIAIVKSSLQLLAMKERTIEEYGHGLALGLDDFTRLELTVQKMLTLARLEQPEENKNTQTCSLRDVVDDVLHQSQPFADIKSIEVLTNIQDDIIVRMDSRDALLLCSNVFLNALQHSKEGGKVWISLQKRDEQTIQFVVRDEGEGVSVEDLPHLFEPFYRGDSSRSRKSGGTGLGLAICRAICHRTGGSIEIANYSKKGAKVTVLLPLSFVPIEPSSSVSIKA